MSDGSSTPSGLRARVLTGVVGSAAVLAVMFGVPADLAFFIWLAAITGAAVEFVRMMRESAEASGALERSLGSGDDAASERAYQRVAASCNACHADYRNDG